MEVMYKFTEREKEVVKIINSKHHKGIGFKNIWFDDNDDDYVDNPDGIDYESLDYDHEIKFNEIQDLLREGFLVFDDGAFNDHQYLLDTIKCKEWGLI